MKKMILTLLLGGLCIGVDAQEDYRTLLSTDPWMSNGYFIVDYAKLQGMGATTVQVDIPVDKVVGGGTPERRTLQTFNITNGLFGKVDPQLLASLSAEETAHYRLRAFTTNGTVVVDHSSVPVGGWAWPEACRTTCHSNLYAWSLVGYSNGAQTGMELHNGTEEGSYFYLYVPSSLWDDFKEQNLPADFGLDHIWPFYELTQNGLFGQPQVDVVRHTTTPPGALMLNGYPVAGNYSTGGSWAIRLDRGPWRDLYGWTNNYSQPSEVCNIMEVLYNQDPLIENARTAHNPDIPIVTCDAMPNGSGGVPWGGPGPFDPCGGISLWDQGIDGSLSIWTLATIDCFTHANEPSGSGLSGVHSIRVNNWAEDRSTNVITVVLPTDKDPKLIPVPKTQLVAGLYEVMIVMDDGRMIRHFEDLGSEATVGADFAAFTHITVYPVPVKDKYFALDLDLLVPMDIELSIVNNMGLPYHHQSLEFEEAGRNKSVVQMTSIWPNGIYHAIFQFEDGSTESVPLRWNYSEQKRSIQKPRTVIFRGFFIQASALIIGPLPAATNAISGATPRSLHR